MTPDLTALIITAASIGFLHTLLGPDHYIPFIVMARAQRWSMTKTVLITILSGTGYVMSSIVLGLLGISFGVAISRFEFFESVRCEIAIWVIIAFGFVYILSGEFEKPYEISPTSTFTSTMTVKHTTMSTTHTEEHVHVHEKGGQAV